VLEAFLYPESILDESETQFRLSSFTEIPSRARANAIFMKFPRRSDDAYTELRRLVYRGNIKVNNDQNLFVWIYRNSNERRYIAFLTVYWKFNKYDFYKILFYFNSHEFFRIYATTVINQISNRFPSQLSNLYYKYRQFINCSKISVILMLIKSLTVKILLRE